MARHRGIGGDLRKIQFRSINVTVNRIISNGKFFWKKLAGTFKSALTDMGLGWVMLGGKVSENGLQRPFLAQKETASYFLEEAVSFFGIIRSSNQRLVVPMLPKQQSFILSPYILR
jgi:hypothetical protein